MPKLQKNNLVAQSNSLIEARYTASKNELVLLVAMISLIDPNDRDFLTFSVTVEELSKILELDKKSALREFKNISKRLLKRVIEVETKDGWEMFQWVSKVTLKGNFVSLQFHNDLKPYLLELKNSGNFTQYRLSMTTRFRSAYTIRIYQLLREYFSKNISEFEFSVEEFRKMVLGENIKKHSAFKVFRRHVLNVAQKELSETTGLDTDGKVPLYKSDLNFDLETRRTGRRISHLIFIIKRQKTKPTKPIETSDREKKSIPSIALEYHRFGITTEQVKPFLEERGEESLKLTLNKIDADHKAGKIKSNVSAYAFKLLQENAGQKTPEEIAEEKRKSEARKSQIKEEKKKLIKELKKSLEIEYGKQEREKFISTLTETGKQDVLAKLNAFYENNPLAQGKVRKGDLFSPFISLGINSLISNFEENREKYVNDKLKKEGLID